MLSIVSSVIDLTAQRRRSGLWSLRLPRQRANDGKVLVSVDLGEINHNCSGASMSGGLKLGHYPFSHRASRASPVADACAIERNGSRLQKSAHQNGRPLPAARRRNAALASGGSNESRQLGFRHPPVYNKPVQPKGLAEGKIDRDLPKPKHRREAHGVGVGGIPQ
jgi:hypothetical protein